MRDVVGCVVCRVLARQAVGAQRLVGELHLPSAFVFDLGVFAVVVGTTMLMLVALAHQSLRAHRLPGDDTAPHTPHDSRHAEGRPL